MSDRRPETTPPARTERRSSIGRLLERFKSKRKSSSQQVATTTTPAADTTSNQPASEPTGPSATKCDAKHTEPKQAPPLAKDPAGTELHANDLDVDDNEDLTPSRFDRFSHSNEKTRALFEKHGIPAPPPSPGAPQLEKDERKRIEKPARMRVHWTCHECQRMFTQAKVCNGCGHRRCRDCVRTPPPKKTKAPVTASETRVEEERSAALTTEPVVLEKPGAATNNGAPRDQQPGLAEEGGGTLSSDEDDNNLRDKYRYSLRTRPRGGYNFMNPDAEAEWRAKGKPTDVQMVATVQRVYRKPRQRIRYTCERCQSTLVDRQLCRSCGHTRCEACTRYPPKRVTPSPDPDVLRAVEERLAAMSLRQVSVQ